MELNIPLVLKAILEDDALPLNGSRGVAHWARVLENGLRLAEEAGAKIGGAGVMLIETEGGGHTWPGKRPPIGFIGKSTKDISANDLMWDITKNNGE